jgi:uncharacterized protein YggE
VFAPGRAPAQPADVAENGRALSVVGEATVRGRPDMAMLTLGVVSDARTAGEALAANTEGMTRILEALKAEGLESRDLQTANFSVEPLYSQPPPDFQHTQPFEPKIVGYRIRNEVAVRIRDLARVGALLDRSVGLGANSVSGPVFTVADPSTLQDQARQAAVRNALDKGKLMPRPPVSGSVRSAGSKNGPLNSPAGSDGRHGQAGGRGQRRRADRRRRARLPRRSVRQLDAGRLRA